VLKFFIDVYQEGKYKKEGWKAFSFNNICKGSME